MLSLVFNDFNFKNFLKIINKLKGKKIILSSFFYKQKSIIESKKININLFKKNLSNVTRLRGYQYFYPYWTPIILKGTLVNIKKNINNIVVYINNNIENYKIIKTFLITSPLVLYLLNQRFRKFNKYLIKIKKLK